MYQNMIKFDGDIKIVTQILETISTLDRAIDFEKIIPSPIDLTNDYDYTRDFSVHRMYNHLFSFANNKDEVDNNNFHFTGYSSETLRTILDNVYEWRVNYLKYGCRTLSEWRNRHWMMSDNAQLGYDSRNNKVDTIWFRSKGNPLELIYKLSNDFKDVDIKLHSAHLFERNCVNSYSINSGEVKPHEPFFESYDAFVSYIRNCLNLETKTTFLQ